MFERLSIPSRQAIVRAHSENEASGYSLALNSGHLLVGLAGRPGDQAERALLSMQLTPSELRSMIDGHATALEQGDLGHFSRELQMVIRAAADRRDEQDEMTTGDLLLAVLDSEASTGAVLLDERGVDIPSLRTATLEMLSEPDPPWASPGEGLWAVYLDGEGSPDNLRWQ